MLLIRWNIICINTEKVEQFSYTDQALEFYDSNKNLGQMVTLRAGTQGPKIQTGSGVSKVGGYWTNDGRIVTFWD